MSCNLTLSLLSRQMIHMVSEVKVQVPSGPSGATLRLMSVSEMSAQRCLFQELRVISQFSLRPAQGRFMMIFFNKAEFHVIDFHGVHLRQWITAKPSQRNPSQSVWLGLFVELEPVRFIESSVNWSPEQLLPLILFAS